MDLCYFACRRNAVAVREQEVNPTMVTIQRSSPQSPLPFRAVLGGAVIFVFLVLIVFTSDPDAARLREQGALGPKPKVVSLVPANEAPKDDHLSHRMSQCPYTSLSDLTESELWPQKGPRHMIDPPNGGQIYISLLPNDQRSMEHTGTSQVGPIRGQSA
jgi:hypothetical protein